MHRCQTSPPALESAPSAVKDHAPLIRQKAKAWGDNLADPPAQKNYPEHRDLLRSSCSVDSAADPCTQPHKSELLSTIPNGSDSLGKRKV